MVNEDIQNDGKNCGNCRFMCRVTKKPRKDDRVFYGECRRFPPVRETAAEYARDEPARPIGYNWPHVHSAQWCGEHKERKLT
jgi:hypothetical protein